MQISKSFHLISQEFNVPVGPSQYVSRSVNIGLLASERIMMFDAGVRNSVLQVKDYLTEHRYSLADLDWLLCTHSHPDHIGGGLSYCELTGCKTAAPKSERSFIEHVDWQAEARPIPGFQKLVEGSFPVDIALEHGNRINFGDHYISVIGTEGHSSGHLSYFIENEGVLFAGDCLPTPGEMPIYENITASIQAIRRLSVLKGIQYLLSSWDDTVYEGAAAYAHLANCLKWLQQIHEAVLTARSKYSDLPVLAREVIDQLDIPPYAMNPLFLKTIQTHLNKMDCDNLLETA